jgi:hypothetical protein
MNTLLKNKDKIFEIKTKVENNDRSLYSHTCVNNNVIDENTISIVMTSSNRSKQTYFTLKTISNSKYKNIQVIIVDDSDYDPINIDTLINANYNFYIDIIKISRENKTWHNPLVNYNIGFNFIKGNKIIIQNSEVCHIGDILSFINDNVAVNNYYVFDVNVSIDFNTNDIIYNSNVDNIDIFNKPLFSQWYQGKNNNRNLHFLTALSKHTFDKIKNFGYDCTMGASWDDDEFLLKILSKHINIINIWHDEYNVGGIHLYHNIAVDTWDKNVELNRDLFNLKKCVYNFTHEYIDVTENKNDFDEKFKKLVSG